MKTSSQSQQASKPASIRWVLDRLRDHLGEPVRWPDMEPIGQLVSTILSQNTSDLNTDRAYASLLARFPDWDAVADASDEEIADAIRSGGLANIKAPRIRRVLQDIRAELGGYDLSFLSEMSVADARAWLTSLDGVGPKTASCVLLFSLDMPAMPVDTHVHRVTSRLGLIPAGTSAEKAHALLEEIIPADETFAAHMLFIQHGRLTCHARRPKCSVCVLVQCCPAAHAFLSDEREQHGS
jgi:endonuclease-3